MKIIQPFDPLASASGTLLPDTVNPCGFLFLINESPAGLRLQFADGAVSVLPPWFARAYRLPVAGAPVAWNTLYTLQATSSPASTVYGESYEPGEIEYSSLLAQVGPLVRQMNMGNTAPVSANVDSINNTGNAAGTGVVSAQATGSTQPNIVINNDGSVSVGQYVGGVFTTLFQVIPNNVPALRLGAPSVGWTDVIGGLAVYGDLWINANCYLSASNKIMQLAGDLILQQGKLGMQSSGDIIDASVDHTWLKSRGTGHIIFQVPNGASIAEVNAGGIDLRAYAKDIAVRQINLTSGALARISKQTANLPGGTSVYTHNLGWVPDYTIITATVSGGGSATVGWSNPNTTQITVTVGAGMHYDLLFLKFTP